MTAGDMPWASNFEMLAGELRMVDRLLPWIATEHLPDLRDMLLSTPSWQLTPEIDGSRRMLLNACARRLINELGGDWPAILTESGELLPDAPDDPSALE